MTKFPYKHNNHRNRLRSQMRVSRATCSNRIFESRDKLDSRLSDWLLSNFGETEFLESKCLEALKAFFDKNNKSVIAALETTYTGIFHIFSEYFRIDSSKKSIARLPEQSIQEALVQMNDDLMNWTWKIVYPNLENTDVDLARQKENLQMYMDTYKSLIYPMSEAIQ